MSLLYVVSESDADAYFYALCAMRFSGREFTPIVMENRKGDGVGAVKLQLKYALRQARAAALGEEPVCFLAAIDNDRAPHNENAGLDRTRLVRREQEQTSRTEWLLATVQSVLGHDQAAWSMPVALATPVEMIESWILRARHEAEPQPARHFSHSDSHQARLYYEPVEPSPQWKDLCGQIQAECGHADKREFYEWVVRDLDADALANRSESFRMFKEWIDKWPDAKLARDEDHGWMENWSPN